MADLPTPVTTNDELLVAIHGVLTQIRDRLPEPAPPAEPGQPVELREPQDRQTPAAEPEPPPEALAAPDAFQFETPSAGFDQGGSAGTEEPDTPGPSEDERAPAADPDRPAPAPPHVRAPKREWVAYAARMGLDETDAQQMSKTDLIRAYGGTRESSTSDPAAGGQ